MVTTCLYSIRVSGGTKQAIMHSVCLLVHPSHTALPSSLTYCTTLIPHILHYPHPSHTALPSSLTYCTTLIPHILHYPHPSRTALPSSLTYCTTLIPHVLHYPHPSHTALPSSLTYCTTLIPHVLHYPHPSHTTLPSSLTYYTTLIYPQLPDKFGITALLAAIYEDHTDCVKLLVSKVFNHERFHSIMNVSFTISPCCTYQHITSPNPILLCSSLIPRPSFCSVEGGVWGQD